MDQIEIIVERTATGYSTYATQYEIFTVARNRMELQANRLVACNLHFEDDGKVVTANNLHLVFDPAEDASDGGASVAK